MLPKVLIIDDQFGRSIRDRRNLCINFGLVDATGDDTEPEEMKNPVASAVFCSGQVQVGRQIINDLNYPIEAIERGWPDQDGIYWSLVLLDIRFVSGPLNNRNEPEGQQGDSDFGIQILANISKKFPGLPIVMLSSRDRDEVIEECRSNGALDFIKRTGYSSESRSPKEALNEMILQHGLLPDVRQLEDESERIIGNSLPLLNALRSARRVATGKSTILLRGESGAGKELLARYVHDCSPRAANPYIIYTPNKTESLQKDELFGHDKGAFTGATNDRNGVFELANKGTLFVDEIGDVSKDLQFSLMRVLESRQVSREGSSKVMDLDLQVVLATNKNLEQLARRGKFKGDLLSRMNAYPIVLPPLRERKTDIPLIAGHLLDTLCKKHGAWENRKLPQETLDLLIGYNWPDNVRELRNVLERAVLNNKYSEFILPSDLEIKSNSLKHSNEANSHNTVAREQSIDDLTIFPPLELQPVYEQLHARLPSLKRGIAQMLIKYLDAALAATKRIDPSTGSSDINLAGAIGCIEGKRVSTLKAADTIKWIMHIDEKVKDEALNEKPLLRRAYENALAIRPTKSTKKSGKDE